MTAESPYPWATRAARLGAREIMAFRCPGVTCEEGEHDMIVGLAAPGTLPVRDRDFATWDEAEAWLREDM
jgi:hypothetical protein